MKTGSFNINDYLEKLYEDALPMMDGGEGLTNADGLIIPDENKKSYDWLKKEYQKSQTEIKVEIKMGDAKFDPRYDLQTDLDSVKEFKPGMYGEIKTKDTPNTKDQNSTGKSSLDPKKNSASFTKEEGEKDKSDETVENKSNINKKSSVSLDKNKDEKEEKKQPLDDNTKVKKIDLKTKK